MDTQRGTRIAELREKLKESQETFGRRFGVAQVAVSRWERGLPVARRYWTRLAALAGEAPSVFFAVDQAAASTRDNPAPGGNQAPIDEGIRIALDHAAAPLREWAASFAPRKVELWQLQTLTVSSRIAPGDYVLVEVGAEPTQLRCVVLAEYHRPDGRKATIFRVWLGWQLITASPMPLKEPALPIDDEHVIVRGVVLAHRSADEF